jgi:hypothetical protein
MNRASPLLCPLFLLGTVMWPTSAQADPELQDKNAAQQILSELRDIRNAINAQREITDIKMAKQDLELKLLQRRVADLEQKLDRFNSGRVANYPELTADELRALRERLDRLERRERTSSSFTPGDIVTPPLPAMGSVRIQNRSLVPSTVVVNGTTYFVRGGETVPIALPVGSPFVFEVLQDARGFRHPPQQRTVPAGDPWFIYINP